MRAKDVMTTQVVSVRPDTPVPEIAKLLLERHISAVPVVSGDGALRGIVSEGDLMRRAEQGTEGRSSWWLRLFEQSDAMAERYSKSHGRIAADVMTGNVVTVDESAPLAEVARVLEEKKVKRVPVMRDGRVVGIVSRANLLRGVASGIGGAVPAGHPDDRAIREKLLSEIAGQAWAHLSDLNIIVEGGTVHLWGTVESPAERKALRVAAEGVPGVKAVEDHLVSRAGLRYAE